MEMEKDFNLFARSSGVNSNTLHDYKSSQNLTPYVIEERKMNASQLDVFSRLMQDRIIFLNEGVNPVTMGIVQAQLLYLDSISNEDIQIYVNTPGGHVIDGLALYDVMKYIKCDIATTIMGMAASMGSIIATSGTHGKRNMLKHSWLMIHDIRGGTQGTFKDQQISLNLSSELRNDLFKILSENSKSLTPEDIDSLGDRDAWIRPERAMELGFIDRII